LIVTPTVAAPVSRADSALATVSVRPGALWLNVPDPPQRIAERPDMLAYNVPLTVTDARGSGAGWHATMAVTSTATADQHAVTATGAQTACYAGSCTPPVNTTPYPIQIPLDDSPTNVFNASRKSGMGTISISLQIEVPAPSATPLLATVTVAEGP
jgi:hypothetical protein